LGWILGPLIGGLLIFGEKDKPNAGTFDSLIPPYMIVGTVVVLVAVIFAFTKLPVIKEDNEEGIAENAPARELLKHTGFILAVIAQFLYVAAQTGVNSFFINYVTETMTGVRESVGLMMSHLGGFGRVFMPQNPEQAASLILALGGMGSFWIGRLTGAWLMKFIAPGRLLAVYGFINTILMVIVILKLGWISVIALFSCYFFMSVMFPTIFALGLRNLGPLTKRAASFLVMAVAGGAFCPPVMGAIADHSGMSIAFILPLACFLFIAIYAVWTNKRTPADAVPLTIVPSH
jgi:FHS family L-fucose permease-like MFS transporter